MPEHRTTPRLPREKERGSAGPPGALSDATRMASSIDARKEGWGGRGGRGGRREPFPGARRKDRARTCRRVCVGNVRREVLARA